MHERTFAEIYCEQRGVLPENYAKTVTRETLYSHARVLASLIELVRPRHFSADIEFAHGVGQIRRYRDYGTEAEGYAHHPENRGYLRALFKVRISSRKMRRLVRTTLHATVSPEAHGAETDPHSAVPFNREEAGAPGLGTGTTGKA